MSLPDYANVRVSVEDRIGLVEINRPQSMNALNLETLDDLERALLALRDDANVGAVIVTGVGEKAFVAGADIRQLTDLDGLSGQAWALRGQAVFEIIDAFPKPVIAAVNGYCLGGGCELAMACHLRIASEDAKFGQPEVKLGLIPGYGGTQRLPRMVGSGRALEILLTGDVIDAGRAAEIGLVNQVVAAGELLGHCRQLAAKMIANAPIAVRLALQAVRSGADVPLERALAQEAQLFGLACGTDDMKEGTKAFIEKRKPAFKGK